MKKLTYEEFSRMVAIANEYMVNCRGMRIGQAYMNALAEWDSKIYNRIVGTEADPYYSDNKLAAFFVAVLPENEN